MIDNVNVEHWKAIFAELDKAPRPTAASTTPAPGSGSMSAWSSTPGGSVSIATSRWAFSGAACRTMTFSASSICSTPSLSQPKTVFNRFMDGPQAGAGGHSHASAASVSAARQRPLARALGRIIEEGGHVDDN